MYYQGAYTPRPSDYNRNGKLSYEAILQILECAAGDHSASAGDSIACANKSGIAWILTEWRVQIVRRPENGETLNITTWVRGKAPASTVYRDFLLSDENGSEIIRAEAKFALFDMKTGRLVRVDEELFLSYQPEEKVIFDNAPRLRSAAIYDGEAEIKLRSSDMDFNGHLHNTRYITLALEGLENADSKKRDFSEFHIVYLKPVRDGNAVQIKSFATETGYLIEICSENTSCSLVEMKN
ncbi:MAG: acyl-[acyl-carrier-protein] thioesterase [Eubacteriales bacterium]